MPSTSGAVGLLAPPPRVPRPVLRTVPGGGAAELEVRRAHDQGVGAGGLVVAAPDADLLETAGAVQLLGPQVVHPYLQEYLGAAAAAGLGQQRVEQRRAGALTLAAAGDRDGDHVGLAARGQQAGVADDLAILLGDQVVPAARLLGQLALQHGPGPGLLAEQLQLQPQHQRPGRPGSSPAARPGPAGRGHGVTRFGRPGSRASGRRR